MEATEDLFATAVNAMLVKARYSRNEWVSHLQDIHDALVPLGTLVHLLLLVGSDAPLWSAVASLPRAYEWVVV